MQAMLIPENDKNLSQKQIEFMQSQSLTFALKQLDYEFSLDLIYLGELNLISKSRIHLLDASEAETFVYREVNLRLNKIPLVRGKSICKAQSDFWTNYLDIGTQALGEKLFDSNSGLKDKNNKISRTAFAWSQEDSKLNLSKNTSEKNLLWTRASVFEFEQQKLLLEETFLPDLKKFIK